MSRTSALLLLFLAGCKGCSRDPDVVDTDTDVVIDTDVADTDTDTDSDADTDTDSDTDTDTGDTGASADLATQVCFPGGSAAVTSPSYSLHVVVGDPIAATEIRSDRFVARVGVGSR